MNVTAPSLTISAAQAGKHFDVLIGGVGLAEMNIKGLVSRVAEGGVREVVLAVNSTVEGQTTAHYITDQLSGLGVKVTRLAHGVPVGGELDYLDEGTLAAALKSRTVF